MRLASMGPHHTIGNRTSGKRESTYCPKDRRKVADYTRLLAGQVVIRAVTLPSIALC